MRSSLRDSLIGLTDDHDRLWSIETPEFTGGITEYNDELTGYDPRFAKIDPKIFRYGGNAYYITGKYAQGKGWKVTEIEDRI